MSVHPSLLLEPSQLALWRHLLGTHRRVSAKDSWLRLRSVQDFGFLGGRVGV
jgi:hypothetical protein